MPDSPRLRVGIVAWNCADALRTCLAALPAALGDHEAEVVVWDNASADDSAEVAADTPGVHLLRSDRNVGYARGMNGALDGADADVLVALNPDTVPAPGSIAALVDVLQRRPDVAVVAPLLRSADGTVQHSVHRFPSVGIAAVVGLLPRRLVSRSLRDRLWLPGAVRPGRTGPVDWAIGAVHVLRASAVGPRPYDERWFVYVEDVALCHRLAHDGWTTWLDTGVEVTHVGNVSGAQAFGQARELRWMGETYDWYGWVHGPVAVRAYAAVNALGVLVRVLGAAARRLRPDDGGRPGLRRWVRLLALHVRVAVLGPRPPAPPVTG